MSKLEYNPNKKPHKIEYATYAPGRSTRPDFKLHKRRTDALLAVSENTILYKLVDDDWVEIFRWDEDNDVRKENCDDCGDYLWGPWHESSWNKNAPRWRHYQGRHKWRDTDTMNPYMNWYCYKCRRKHG